MPFPGPLSEHISQHGTGIGNVLHANSQHSTVRTARDTHLCSMSDILMNCSTLLLQLRVQMLLSFHSVSLGKRWLIAAILYCTQKLPSLPPVDHVRRGGRRRGRRLPLRLEIDAQRVEAFVHANAQVAAADRDKL